MPLQRRIAVVLTAAVSIGVALVGCAPAAQNGATMSLPSVVPAPLSIEAGDGGPFPLDAKTQISGDTDAAAALAGLVSARTGLTLATGGDGGIQLSIESGGPAESYRIDSDADSVV